MIPKPGIYKGVPEEEYHSWEAVSKSSLTKFSKNPGKFKLCPQKTTKEMKLGSAIDNLVFDGENTLYEEFAIKPEFKGKGSVKARTEWEQEYSHLTPITQKEATDCINAANAVQENKLARKYLTDSLYQLSIVWIDEETGLLCKCRPDIKPEGPVIVDLKSTGDTSYSQFQRIFYQMKYHWQAAFYSEGWEANTGEEIEVFPFIVVEREYPYPVEVYLFKKESDSWDLAQTEIRDVMNKYLVCKESESWPVSSGIETEINLPGYAWKY
jgi:exodeoxyribonuclease VIII